MSKRPRLARSGYFSAEDRRFERNRKVRQAAEIPRGSEKQRDASSPRNFTGLIWQDCSVQTTILRM